MPIIDPHHHFWDEGGHAESFGRLLPDDLTSEIAACGHHVVATVFVECGWSYRSSGPMNLRCVGETERVIETTGRSVNSSAPSLAAAIVGHADLQSGAVVQEVLEAHLAAAPERFRGIRENAAADADYPWGGDATRQKLRSAQFRAGFARLGPLGLSCDLWCLHPQIEEVTDLARAFPLTTIVLNHLGTPLGLGRFNGRHGDVFDQWRQAITELALCPNVCLKIGGLGMGLSGWSWSEIADPPDSLSVGAAYRPYVLHAIERFSPGRCMFESNFPVDGISYGYRTVWNAFKRVSAEFSTAERRELFFDTAARVYRISSVRDSPP